MKYFVYFNSRMIKKVIAKRLGINLLLTFVFSSFLTFLSIQIYYSKEAGSLEGNQGITIMTLAGIFWTFVLTLCSLTVFFNLNDKVRQNKFISSLTFFLVPILIATIVFIKSDFQDMWQSFFLMTLSFMVTQVYFFIKFSKTNFDDRLEKRNNSF